MMNIDATNKPAAVSGSRDGIGSAIGQGLVLLFLCAALVQLSSPGQARPCSDEVEELRAAAGSSGAAPSAPQSTAAQLGRQPTPESVREAQEAARSNFEAMLARAEALDAEGKQAECMETVAAARRSLELR